MLSVAGRRLHRTCLTKCVACVAAHRPVLDRHTGDAAALLPGAPGRRGQHGQIGAGAGADLGVERAADAQLLQEGRVAVGEAGGLEVLRDARAVRQDLVVDVLLRRLPLPAGKFRRSFGQSLECLLVFRTFGT